MLPRALLYVWMAAKGPTRRPKPQRAGEGTRARGVPDLSTAAQTCPCIRPPASRAAPT